MTFPTCHAALYLNTQGERTRFIQCRDNLADPIRLSTEEQALGWVAVKEFNPSYCSAETIAVTIYTHSGK